MCYTSFNFCFQINVRHYTLDFRVGGEEEGDDATSGVSVVPDVDVNVTRARVTVTREDYDQARMDNTSLSECPAECGQGLTLVHFSTQPEPFLTQNTPSTTPNTAQHPLNAP